MDFESFINLELNLWQRSKQIYFKETNSPNGKYMWIIALRYIKLYW